MKPFNIFGVGSFDLIEEINNKGNHRDIRILLSEAESFPEDFNVTEITRINRKPGGNPFLQHPISKVGQKANPVSTLQCKIQYHGFNIKLFIAPSANMVDSKIWYSYVDMDFDSIVELLDFLVSGDGK